MVTTTDKWNTLPDSALAAVLRSLHDACLWVLRADAPGASESTHYCSLRTPCATAAEAFRPVQAFRSVATAWNRAFQKCGYTHFRGRIYYSKRCFKSGESEVRRSMENEFSYMPVEVSQLP